jgi:hypothetical protein
VKPVAVDIVAITRAEFITSERKLRVEASSARAEASLQVSVTSTGQFIGTLTNKGRRRFQRPVQFERETP